MMNNRFLRLCRALHQRKKWLWGKGPSAGKRLRHRPVQTSSDQFGRPVWQTSLADQFGADQFGADQFGADQFGVRS